MGKLERQTFARFAHQRYLAVAYFPALAIYRFAAIFLKQIAAIGKCIKTMACAVFSGDIFDELSVVEGEVSDFLIMRQYICMGEPQTWEEASVIGIDAFARFFRLRIDGLCAVHAACADAHNYAGECFEFCGDCEFIEPSILRGHMSAAQDDEIALVDEVVHIGCVAAIEADERFENQAAAFERGVHGGRAVIAETWVIRGGSDEQYSGLIGYCPLEVFDEMILGIDMAVAILAWAACEKENHDIPG